MSGLPALAVSGHGRYRWTLIAFALAGLLVAAFAGWQLAETTPARWCGLAQATSPEGTTACLTVLLKVLEIKDHAVILLLSTLALTVLSVVVVALGVKLTGEGPGGFRVDVSADETQIQANGGSVTIPTPPKDTLA